EMARSLCRRWAALTAKPIGADQDAVADHGQQTTHSSRSDFGASYSLAAGPALHKRQVTGKLNLFSSLRGSLDGPECQCHQGDTCELNGRQRSSINTPVHQNRAQRVHKLQNSNLAKGK